MTKLKILKLLEDQPGGMTVGGVAKALNTPYKFTMTILNDLVMDRLIKVDFSYGEIVYKYVY